jgi:hypothetical protein
MDWHWTKGGGLPLQLAKPNFKYGGRAKSKHEEEKEEALIDAPGSDAHHSQVIPRILSRIRGVGSSGRCPAGVRILKKLKLAILLRSIKIHL